MSDRPLTLEEQAIGQIAANIIEVPIETFLHKNSLPYSQYVIRNRALVSVDGLKPVQRRILYSMILSNITNKNKHVKAATIAGNVMGSYHPHGNVSIEDALARMGQDFTLRVPLIDVSGSVGYFTGDPASAARYWEARLTPAAMELVSELKDDALPMSRNYDDSLPEPAILPARWPAAIINGTEGIAVGYASKIFPHNPTEVMKVAVEMVKNPDLTIDEILKIMPGPDFPTGGELVGHENIRECYLEGSGSFTVRGRYRLHQLSRGRVRIEFYELPYQVSADDVIAKIKTARAAGRITEISQEKDWSDKKSGLRLAITVKSGANIDSVLEKLFKFTPASKSFSLNQTVLDNGTPSQLNLFEIMAQFLEFRRTCILTSTGVRRDKVVKELENNNGLIKVIVDIDKALEIIKTAETAALAKKDLRKHFKLTEAQAEYILNMQLRKLTRSDRDELASLNDKLKEKVKYLEAILNDEDVFKQELISQLESTAKVIGDPRRTIINNKTAEEIKEEELNAKAQASALSKDAPYSLTVYADGGLFKSLDTSGAAATKHKLPFMYKMEAKMLDPLYAVLPDGRGIKFPSTYIPFDNKVKASSIGIEHEYLAIGKMNSTRSDLGLLVVTNKGRVALINGRFPTTLDEFPIVSLEDGETVVHASWLSKADQKLNLLLGSNEGLATLFAIDTLRVSNPGVQPIKGMGLDDEAKIVGVSIVGKKGVIITTTKQSIKMTNLSEIPVRGRGTKGIVMQRLGKGGDMTAIYGADENELSVTDEIGNEIFLPPITGRALTGTKFPTVGLVIGRKEIPTPNDISNKANKGKEG